MTRGKIFSFATMMVSAQRRHAARLATQPAPVPKPVVTAKSKLKPARAAGSSAVSAERKAEVAKLRPGVPWLQLT